MLTDEQEVELGVRIAQAVRRADGNHDTGAGEIGERVAEELAPLIEQWVSEAVRDALTTGDLPDGWKRTRVARVEERYRFDNGRFLRPDGSEIDISDWPQRTVITGPWQKIGGGDEWALLPIRRSAIPETVRVHCPRGPR